MGSNPTFSEIVFEMSTKSFSSYDKTCFLYCRFSNQNSIFTLTTLENVALLTLSNGMCGFKNNTRKTKFATNFTALKLGKEAVSLNFKEAVVVLKGLNSGRQNLIKFLQKQNLNVVKVIDQTPMAHNGCRPPKKPRL